MFKINTKIQFSDRSLLFRIVLVWVLSPFYIGLIIIVILLALQLMIFEKISFSTYVMADMFSLSWEIFWFPDFEPPDNLS